MIPHFQPPVRAQMVRDGGSLSFSFSADDCKYGLLFPVLFDQMGRRSGYGLPRLANKTLGSEDSISWEEALSWLKEGLKYLDNESDREWGEAMIETCTHSGELPDIMNDSPTELGRIFIGRDLEGAPSTYEFRPFEIQYDWQKRIFVSKQDQEFLRNLVIEKNLTMVGGSAFSCFEVAARFDLNPDGKISGISRLALLAGENFVEILK